MSKKQQSEKVVIPEGTHGIIPLAFITPDPNQPRKHFDEVKLQELAESIKSIGVTQNIIVQKNDADGYTIIAGERRYRGSLLAGKEDIPAMIYPPLPEDVVKEIQIAENLHRQDMNAMEESDAFFDLTKRGMTTAADIAKRIGKSEGYVYDRLALQNCIEHVQEMLRKNSLPITHGKQFAKLSLEDQQGLWDLIISKGAEVSLSDLKNHISDRFSMVLDNAPFNLKDANLIKKAGACIKCPKRSGCNGLLFDDVSSKDICFDKTCYDSKVAAHIEEVEKKLRSEGKTVHRIVAQWMSETPAGVLRIEHFGPVGDDEEPDAYGIVMHTGYKVDNVEVGSVVGIKYTSSGRDFLGLPDEDETDDGNDDDDTNSSRSHIGPDGVDHDVAFTERLSTALINKFNEDPSSIRLSELEINRVVKHFRNFEDDYFKHICKVAGWEIVVDEDDDDSINIAATVVLAYKKMEFGASFIEDLGAQLYILENSCWERSDIPRILGDYPDIHVDIAAEMDAYEQETGHKFND